MLLMMIIIIVSLVYFKSSKDFHTLVNAHMRVFLLVYSLNILNDIEVEFNIYKNLVNKNPLETKKPLLYVQTKSLSKYIIYS